MGFLVALFSEMMVQGLYVLVHFSEMMVVPRLNFLTPIELVGFLVVLFSKMMVLGSCVLALFSKMLAVASRVAFRLRISISVVIFAIAVVPCVPV